MTFIKKTVVAIAALSGFSVISALSQDGYVRHIVRWFDDLTSISATYNVPKDVIIKANDLKDTTLRARQLLIIPTDRSAWSRTDSPVETPAAVLDAVKAETVEEKEATAIQDTVATAPVADTMADTAASSIAAPAADTAAVSFSDGRVKLGILLPMSSGNSVQDGNNIDFYTGVLMAARELAEQGYDIDIDITDCSEGVFEASAMKDKNFIIGPVKAGQLSQVLAVVDSSTIVVSPLDHRADSLLQGHPNFIQAAPLAIAQFNAAIKWCIEEATKRSDTNPNVILVSNEYEVALLGKVKKEVEGFGLKCRSCFCGTSQDIPGWENVYDPLRNNIVILAMTNEAILNNAVRLLGIYAKERDNIIIAGGNKLSSYETMPLECLHKANIRSLCPYYVDHNDQEVRRFVRSYRALFNTDPSEFAFQGYDIAYFLVSGKSDMLQASFHLERIPGGGQANYGMRRVLFRDDFRVELTK